MAFHFSSVRASPSIDLTGWSGCELSSDAMPLTRTHSDVLDQVQQFLDATGYGI